MAAKVNVYKRGKTWTWQFEGAPIGGKRKQYTKGGFPTAATARAAGMQAWNEYNQAGEVRKVSDMSFSDYLDLWLESYGINLKTTTVLGYKKRINVHIRRELGKYRMKSLTPAILQRYINGLFDAGYSRNTVSSIKGILSGSLAYAVEPLHLLITSPMQGVKMPSCRATPATPSREHPNVVIDQEQMAAILARFPEGSSPYIPLLLGYRCGLRLGEAYGLTWDDIDFTRDTIAVRRQVQMGPDKVHWMFTPPKYDSVRTISMDPVLRDALWKRRILLENCREAYAEYYHQITVDAQGVLDTGEGKPVFLVNIRENGTYIQPRTMTSAARVIHGDLNIPEFTYHSLRHTHATRLMETGVNPKAIQQRLGHKKLVITMNTYGHATERMEEELRRAMMQIK